MRRLVGAVAVLGMLTLSGCGGSDPLPTLPPTPSSTPVFASEEEALAAAEEAYSAYQAAVDLALQTLDDSGLSAVAIGRALEAAQASVANVKAEGGRQVGDTKLISVFPTDLSGLVTGSGDEVGQIYGCLDLTEVGILNSDGSVSQSGIAGFPTIVTVQFSDGQLLVEEEDVWDGENFCD